jgi:Selenocysteine lyase
MFEALSVSWVGFVTGVVADLDRLGAACRARGIIFVVDGIQGVGAIPLDVGRTPVDLLACGAQKWLHGPWGSGLTYVAPAVMDRLGRAAGELDGRPRLR